MAWFPLSGKALWQMSFSRAEVDSTPMRNTMGIWNFPLSKPVPLMVRPCVVNSTAGVWAMMVVKSR